MSRTNVTTHDLFMQLGSNGRVRSVRADAVFRRLRFEQSELAAPPVRVEDAPGAKKSAPKRAKRSKKSPKKSNTARRKRSDASR